MNLICKLQGHKFFYMNQWRRIPTTWCQRCGKKGNQ